MTHTPNHDTTFHFACDKYLIHVFPFMYSVLLCICIWYHVFVLQGSPVSAQVYERYPVGLGAALYQEQFDFNAEPPWDPSW